MILGVDPGLKGALAYFDGTALSIRDMPTTTRQINGSDRRVIDVPALAQLLRSASIGAKVMVRELVGGMPGQSGPAAFTFGYGVGALDGLAAAYGLRVETVAPTRWTGALGLMHGDKDGRRARAAQEWPQHAGWFKRKMDDGRADAALIALYGWQVFGRLTP